MNTNNFNTFILSVKYGLCNRLRTLVVYQALAELYKFKFKFCWELDYACSSYFCDLFVSSLNQLVSERKYQKYTKSTNTIVCDFQLCTNYSVWQKYTTEKLKKNKHLFKLVWEPLVQKKAQSLQLKEPIKKQVLNFYNTSFKSNVIGLHVRRTDHIHDKKHYAKTNNWGKNNFIWSKKQAAQKDSTLLKLITKEIKLNKQTQFFLATDDQKTEQKFVNSFPNNIVVYPKHYDSSKLRQTTMQEALTDLYLLSMCKKVVGTTGSSFSLYAAKLGGIKCFLI